VTLLVVGFASAQGSSAPGFLREPLDPRVMVKTGAVGALSDAGIFVALDRGFFKPMSRSTRARPSASAISTGALANSLLSRMCRSRSLTESSS
jgi:hypothetical protein